MAHEVAIRGGTLVDGTGTEGRRADIGIDGGVIVEIGAAVRGVDELDASGALVTPGFIDLHTHYDAQVLWDPFLTSSSLQGVTSVASGICGFSLAPCPPAGRDLMLRTMEFVEGMDRDTLDPGPMRRVDDFPGGGSRLVADRPAGFWHILVNGVPIRRDTISLLGELFSLPGQVLRSC